MKRPRTYEATKARWKDPASRKAAAERMRELHRRAKMAGEPDGEKRKPIGRK